MRLRRRPVQETIETDTNLDVRFWTQQLMVSRAALLLAVATVGRDVAAVRAFLANTGPNARSLSEIRRIEHRAEQGGNEATIGNVQYVSRPAPTLDTADLEAILSWSRDYNRVHGITGVLLFTGRHFSQVLEGPPAVVHELMDSIRLDPRHRDVRVVLDVATTRRAFDGWSMAWVEDFGLRALLEELWWVASVDSTRAALRATMLVRHLRHAVGAGPVMPMHEGSLRSCADAPASRERHDDRPR